MQELRAARQRLRNDAEFEAVRAAFLESHALRIRAEAGLGCGAVTPGQYEEARAQLVADLRRRGAPQVRPVLSARSRGAADHVRAPLPLAPALAQAAVDLAASVLREQPAARRVAATASPPLTGAAKCSQA